jgi:4-diphosphocytidyl-2-C-methyl-D-erythritol kinase
VPFCQVGGRALVTGVGEVIEPLPYIERHVTLLLPSFGVSTAEVYRAYDECVARGERLDGRNHLERPAGLVEPRLARTLAWARSNYGDVHVAGSGSTLFVEGHLELGATQWDVNGPDGLVHVVQTVTTPAGR